MMKLKQLSVLVLIGFSGACDPAVPQLEQGLVISDARVQTPMTGKTITSGYFDITNHSKISDAIIGVESPVAERVEMHQSKVDENGVMKMRRQVAIDIKPGETINFKPGGHHLMLFGVTLEADQTDAAITFKFKHAPDVTVITELAETALHTNH